MRIAVLALLILPLLAFTNTPKLKKRKLTDGVTMLLPESFITMTEEDMKKEVLTYRQPIVMYKDIQSQGNMALNISATRWSKNDLGMLQSFYKSTLLSTHSEVEFIQESIKDIGGNQFAVFEFTSAVKPVRVMLEDKGSLKKYNYIQYTIVGNKVMIFSFSCPIALRKHWQGTIKQMMDSAVVKDK
ncbi:MAG: hypothetical protein ACPGJS_03970 [Flammeovirgaceae bacterium]